MSNPHSVPESDWLPLSVNARGIYFGWAIDPHNPCYNTAELVRFPADTDLNALRAALVQLYAENEGFRVRTRLHTGAAQQLVLDIDRFVSGIELLPVHSLEAEPAAPGQDPGAVQDAVADTAENNPVPPEVQDWAAALLSEALNPDEGITVRSGAVYCAGSLWVYHSFHHVVADGFAAFNGLSRMVGIYRELAAGKEAPPARRASLAELVAADSAAAAEREADYAYWTEDQPRALTQPDTSLASRSAPASARALRVSLPLEAPLQTDLLAAGKMYGASWPVVITAATGAYLGRAGGYDSAAFGVPQMNRMFTPATGAAARELGKVSAGTGTTAVNVLPVQVPSTGAISRALDTVREQFTRNGAHPLARQEDLERIASNNASRLFGAQINVVPFDAVLRLGGTQARDKGQYNAAAAHIHNISAGPVVDMTVTVRGTPGRGNTIYLELDANPQLYTPLQVREHAERLASWLHRWARAALEERALDTLPAATDGELALVEGLNDTAHPVEYKTLLERFCDAVANYRDEPALYTTYEAQAPGVDSSAAYDFSSLTYGELDARARRLAGALLNAGVCPGDAVGLRFNRGPEQYIALYALLYAGAIYVPVLPDLPAERIGHMLTDANCSVLLNGPKVEALNLAKLDMEGTNTAQRQADISRAANTTRLTYSQREDAAHPVPEDSAAHPTVVQLSFGELAAEGDTPREHLPGADTGLNDTAYILFTSGSTGRPKGVAISHRAIDNRLRWQQSQIPVGPGDRVLHKTPISFDVHVWELYWPLQEGAAAVVATPGGHRDPQYLARIIIEQDITCLHFVPTMLAAFLASPAARRTLGAAYGENGSGRLRYVVCSGEALLTDQVLECHRVLGTYPLNLYGPTEAAVDVTFWDTAENPQRQVVPIGKPVWNTGTHILDIAGQPVPVGVPGELYLSGVQLASGYVNNQKGTEAAFSVDARTGSRLYRTGDLAQWELLPETPGRKERGVIIYRGRADNQVKLHGQRLELGDIEAALATLEPISGAVALLHEGTGTPALAAFLEVGEHTAERAEQIIADAREVCERTLPEYMVPTLWQVLDTLPVSPSGKADRKRLAGWTFTVGHGGQDGPHGLLEQQLCAIFARVLRRERFGAEEDFFAAGGHSLTALEVIALAEEELGLSVSIGALFAHPTPRTLAESVHADSGGEFAPVLPLRTPPAGQTPGAAKISPLFILPPAGGLGWCYAGYLAQLPTQQPVFALQAEAFANADAGYAPTLDKLALGYLERIIRTLDEQNLPKSIELMGWSVGGTAAVEVAALAQQAGIEVHRTVLLDAYPAEQWQGIPAPDEQESYRALLRMGGLPEPENEELTLAGTLAALKESGSAMGYLPEDKLAVCLGSMRASTALMRGAQQRHFNGPVTLVTVPHDDQPYLSAHGWEEHVAELKIIRLPEGTHPDLVNPARIGEIVRSAF